MRVVKPASLGLLPRPYRYRQCHYLAVGALGFFSLGVPAERFLPELSQWPRILPVLPPKEPLDLGMPKPHGEMLLAATAFAPDANPVTRMTVRASLGAIDKSLLVIGDRRWKRGVAGGYTLTEPEPFAQMPITYSRAFGGARFPPNKQGVGYLGRRALSLFGAREGPVWNIEHPWDPVWSPTEPHAPAGWGPLDICSPARQAKAGTYDEAWLKHDFPGLAADVDWSLFNCAPEDQHIAGTFQGAEPYRLEGMHPSRPVIEGQLPAFRVRCLIHRKGMAPDSADESPMVCDTVWLFPALELGVLIYRAQVQIADSDGLDVESVVLAYESTADSPRPVDHYRDNLSARMDTSNGVLHAMNDAPLMPLVADAVRAARMEKRSQAIAADLAKQQALLDESMEELWRQSGIEPPPPQQRPKVAPPSLPPVSAEDIANGDVDLAGMLSGAQAKAEELRKQSESQLADLSARMTALQGEQARSPPPDEPEQLAAAVGRAALRADDLFPDLPPSVPLGFRKLEPAALDPAVRQQVEASIRQLPALQRAARRSSPSATYPKVPLTPTVASELGRVIQGWRAQGERLAGCDFAGANLRGASFVGEDLREVMLENADLSNTNFRAARLAGAVFTGARLDGADFTGADLTGAMLGGVRARETRFGHACLDKANLSAADCTRADFTGATLTSLLAVSTVLDGCHLTGSNLSRAMLTRASAVAADFCGCRFERSVLMEANLLGANFSEAVLEKTVLLNAKASWSLWRGSRLTGVQCGGTASFRCADLSGAVASQCGWRGTDLRGTLFRSAQMLGCDFGLCRLDGADLSDALLWRSLFMQATLRNCRVDRADFFQAMCRKADLSGSKLDRARTTQADFSEAVRQDCAEAA